MYTPYIAALCTVVDTLAEASQVPGTERIAALRFQEFAYKALYNKESMQIVLII